MRIVLTGAGGYIGLHTLRELLEARHQVTAVVRSSGKLGPFARHPRLTICEIDLEDAVRIAEVMPGHDVCVHGALIWGDPGDELKLRDTSVAAKLFEAAGDAGLTRCIYLSSVAVHRPFSGEMSEDDGLSATDLYGATKAAGELFLRAACAGRRMTGVVVRPGPVVGPPAFAEASFRSDDRIAAMVVAAKEGRPLEAARDDGRQFSDVRAVAKVIRVLATAESPHATYICVDRDVIAWERVARLVVASLNSRSEVRVSARETQSPVPRFRTERVDRLIGGSSSAEGALLAHIRYLARIAET
ncbi:NAD(P)-dependent oxidoreductase [Methylosinus sp. KRF6]|uniref:NAD-dependent epimerase/dehydratase family protein n=1 Tax=Methylosinus sp. KRF6 TaxID=2846853 RepID=UPI001C0BCBE8|nr:NAD-dependent epimerase/dehydratase family protein [Methylosinus sp. KRF6]MBU3890682.1 NAD(P)-dependent oxidoreductase [Methylosinus sp. KRF6]